MPLRILGIDPSLTSTGLSRDGEVSTIRTQLRGAERLSAVSSIIVDLCKESGVNFVVIEGYSFGSRNSQAHSIGEMGGCIRMRLWEIGVPFVDVPPTVRAKFATGRGNASKHEVISAVSAKTGRVFAGSGGADECDAWVLEQIGLYHAGESEFSWPQTHTSALDKVDWSSVKHLIGDR